MKSNAAIWAGSGAPPPLTKGDTATMAAPRPGMDPSLNPGAPGAIESNHTTMTAAAEAELKAKEEAAAAKEAKAEASLAQKKEEPTAKQAAQAKAAKTKAEVAAAAKT